MSYARSLSYVDNKLRSFHPASGGYASTNPMLSAQWSPGPFSSFWASSSPPSPTSSSPTAPTRHTYDMVVQLSLAFASDLSYLCLSTFVRSYDLRRFLFLNKMDLNPFLTLNYMCHYINDLL
ncbi:hypothetical protein GW17_00041699 [Ensete ventricosum]|uniref:Uncharacterized protein n=1 Tax=Ensete ventricosum TaxID=4639 RepID=A0A444DBW3_ENSVE|nr:hypothetical protein GW17_00041699 [Ensete ventricosum]RZR73818.1 hypothetical protein BHM03_00028445 [Ensete ventricosum]